MQVDENDLVRQLAAATISKLKMENSHGLAVNPKAPGLLNLPAIPMKKIFSLVASRTFNKPPPYHELIKARCMANPRTQERADAEYSVKNLMSLRRVCRQFEDTINNLSPGVDFEPIGIDVKLQGLADSRCVTLHKYGGTGSKYSSIRLNRIRRFNEFHEHIEHFEKLNNLYIVNVPLSEELFETLRRLDLKNLKKISFEKIPEVKFTEGVDVGAYVQQFVDSLDSSSRVFFNSVVFDPNVVLFGGVVPDEPMDLQDVDDMLLLNSAYRYHKNIRSARKGKLSHNTFGTMTKNSINIVSNLIVGTPLIETAPKIPEEVKRARKSAIEKLNTALHLKTGSHSVQLKKSGRFHLRKVLALLEKRPIKDRHAIYFHLKMLKKICKMEPCITPEEKQLVQNFEEERAREQFLKKFPFIGKLPRVRRTYLTEVRLH